MLLLHVDAFLFDEVVDCLTENSLLGITPMSHFLVLE
jgi:hypothetical protein